MRAGAAEAACRHVAARSPHGARGLRSIAGRRPPIHEALADDAAKGDLAALPSFTPWNGGSEIGTRGQKLLITDRFAEAAASTMHPHLRVSR